jgi:mono/diheme cytochrome c family protein
VAALTPIIDGGRGGDEAAAVRRCSPEPPMQCNTPTLLVLAALLATAGAARAEDGDPGKAILTEKCAGCHAVGRDGDSPLEKAPRFRELSQRFPIDSLEEALAEGIVTGHPDMPAFEFEPAEIEAILGYLEAIQTAP